MSQQGLWNRSGDSTSPLKQKINGQCCMEVWKNNLKHRTNTGEIMPVVSRPHVHSLE